MKTYYVGSKHFFNRFNNLEAAIERAKDDDIIELYKDEKDISLYINKNITINGHGHLITPKDNKAALDCASFVTLNDIKFECKPRTNAVVIRNGGNLSNITTCIIGPARALYPTIVQKGGTLTLSDSKIMQMETHKSCSNIQTVTLFKKSKLVDYYNGSAYLDNDDYNLSKFRGITGISESDITCALLEGNCKLSDTILRNFNKATGIIELKSCTLKSEKDIFTEQFSRSNEPIDGPLRNLNPNVIPYALHIAGGKAMVENFSSDIKSDCIGFYMTNGSLDIRLSNNDNNQARHLITGGAVVFNNVTDTGYYEIKKARCGIIHSSINTSSDFKSAMEELNGMIGLNSVKDKLRTIVNTISVNMKYPEKDFGFSHHMIFAGDPGTGKTTVAKLVAQALFEIGAIPENKCIEMSASQLIKGFVGQTGAHVESVMKRALGGVLFIDEAYELMVKEGQNTFNNDVLSVMLRYMEDHRKELVIIAAGYEKEMRQLLASNVGLTRRFQWISFEDYTPEEMAAIFISMSKQYHEDYNFENPHDILTDVFKKLTQFYLMHPDVNGRITNGGNGGLVRNLFQQVVFSRNNRIADCMITTMKITKEDIQSGFNEEMRKALNVQVI